MCCVYVLYVTEIVNIVLAADTEVNGEVVNETDPTEQDKTSGLVNGKVWNLIMHQSIYILSPHLPRPGALAGGGVTKLQVKLKLIK